MLEPVLVFKDKNETVPYSKIVVPSSMRSPLWKFFGFPANEKNEILTKKKIVCCLCRTYIAYNKNTTNLSTHLNCKHPEILAECQSSSKIIRYDPSDETCPKVKRTKIETKFNNEIDTDWYIEHETDSQTENISHPTGITVKEFIHTKKSSQINENYALIISSDDQDDETHLIETLNYDNKEYGDGSADELQQKDDFLTDDDFLSDINEENVRVVYESSGENNSHGKEIKENGTKKLAVGKGLKVIDVPKLMDHLKKFLIKDLVDANIVNGTGFKALMESLSPNVEIPEASRIQKSLKFDYDHLRLNTVAKLDSILSQHKYSILINKIGSGSFLEISISFSNETENRFDGLERQIVCLCQNGEQFFDSITSHTKNCCAIVINFELLNDEDQTILDFSSENDIPIIQSFSSVLELAMSKCSQIACVKEALVAVEGAETNTKMERNLGSCLAKLKTLSELIDGNEEIPSETIHKIQIFINCLQPLENCLDVLAFESTTYASIMKPIALELLNQRYVEKEASVEVNETAHETLERDLKRIISDVLQEKIISNQFLTMASFLDPRFQRLTSADDLSLIRRSPEKLCNQTITSQTFKTNSRPQKRKPERNSYGLSSLFANHSPATKVKMPKNRFDMEFRSYNEDVSLDMDQCPVTWWFESEILYPNLKHQVEKYFCVPAFVNDLHRLPLTQQIKLHERYTCIDRDFDQTLLWLHLNDINSPQ